MLTEEEKWHFDIQGYLVLRNAVCPEDVARMMQLADEWHALEESELPAPLWTYRDASTRPTSPRSITMVEYADEVFERLVLNREIMRVVLALTDNCPQHAGTALARNTRETDDLPFHGGPPEEYRDLISPELFEFKQPASFRHRKKVVQRLLDEMGEGQ